MRKKIIQPPRVTEDITVRDFTGGWNTLDDDLNLESKYAVVSDNVYNSLDGNKSVRYGTKLLSTMPAGCVNMEYFNGAFIVVLVNGNVYKVLADGTQTVIWNTAIAAALPGAPAAWTNPTAFASFAQFNGELIICNGVDKPILVRNNFTTVYLQDLGSGSNLHTPTARYVVPCNRFLVMAGDPTNPNRVHISSRGTSGTFFGDPAPNDGTFVDIGNVLPNASVIRGISVFRNKLIVTYAEGTVIGILGIYNAAGTHTPDFSDVVPNYGSVSHRSIQGYGDDMLMMDLVGVPALKRTVLTDTIRPDRTSDLVDKDISTALASLSFGSIQDRVFSVFNRQEAQFMFFVPNADTQGATTQTTCYAFTYKPTQKLASWARLTGWNWTCAARSLGDVIAFGDISGGIYTYGSKFFPNFVDFLGNVGINAGLGLAITYAWEFPWTDFGSRQRLKQTTYIAFDTRGTGPFTINMYCDRFRTSALTLLDTPQLTMKFVGGDTGGFGDGPQNYGGGRDTANELQYKWPAKFKIAKLQITGTTTTKISFVSISMGVMKGRVQR